MKIHSLFTGNFMLDGGAMFGVVPKTLWEKVYPANEKNLCNLSMRLLLIEAGNRKILIDTGIGNKQDDKFFSHYYLNDTRTPEDCLARLQIKPGEITDVLLTHLHFDHCGGAVKKDNNTFFLTFPEASHWVSRKQWEWAMDPNQREKASFLKENLIPIKESGKLKFIENNQEFYPGIDLKLFNGHTEGLIVPFINTGPAILVYVNDLIPTAAHIPLSWVCGFDTQPLLTFHEKDEFLREAYGKGYFLFFEHDVYTECCTLKNTEKGIRMDEGLSLKEIVL